MLSTGFPYDIRTSTLTNLDHWANFAMNAQALRRDGAAAIDLCYIACGRFDGFWELNLSPWDMAAGALMILEAGGLVSDLGGDEGYLDKGEIACATPKVFPGLLEALRA
jgi:myo-inositol-1(or 4)-monophosphatase